MRRREWRAKERLSDVLKKLNETKILNDNQALQMEAYSHIPLELFNGKYGGYSDEQRRFAVTLHLYGSKAYDYVRQKIPLPHPRSLRR